MKLFLFIIDFTFILRRFTKESPGRFFRPQFSHLDLVVFLWMMTDIYEGVSLLVCKFYLTGGFPVFIGEYHIDFKGSVHVFYKY